MKISNPSTEGGYTITDSDGNILVRKFVKSSPGERLLTSNYTEFLGLFECLKMCEAHDTIFTDSQNNIHWSTGKFRKKSRRKDLIPLAQEVNKLLTEKFITLEWVPRELNWAGLANESMNYI